MNSNIDGRESEINETNSLPVGINNTSIKGSWAEDTEKADIIRELLKEDTKKREIIEELVRERERLKADIEDKSKIIQDLLKGKIIYEKKLKEANKEIRTEANKMGDIGGENIVAGRGHNNTDYKRMTEKQDRNTNHQINSFRSYKGKSKDYNWKKLPCKLHGSGHTSGECRMWCGFCRLKGSHTGESCWGKSEKIKEFLEKWTQTHGVEAKTTAESFIKTYGITHPTKEEFERRLKRISKLRKTDS